MLAAQALQQLQEQHAEQHGKLAEKVNKLAEATEETGKSMFAVAHGIVKRSIVIDAVAHAATVPPVKVPAKDRHGSWAF